MCRAVWVVVAGSDEERCKALRRAAGPDSQVVLLATEPGEILSLEGPMDAAVLDAEMDGARGLAEELRASRPGTAVVWVGEDAPEQAHHAIAWNTELNDSLPGAITKALIARGAAGRTTT